MYAHFSSVAPIGYLNEEVWTSELAKAHKNTSPTSKCGNGSVQILSVPERLASHVKILFLYFISSTV